MADMPTPQYIAHVFGVTEEMASSVIPKKPPHKSRKSLQST